jgi:hypothetical protein
MKKFPVYAVAFASKYVGEIEADSIEEAKEKINDWGNANDWPTLHTNITNDFDLGETDYEIEGEE